MILADTAVELGDLETLRKYAPILEKLAIRDDHKLYLAIAHRAMAVAYRLTGDPIEAENRLRKALGLFTKLGTRWQIGRTLFALGELHRSLSNEKAREYYSQALGAFEEIQAALYAERTRGVLNELN